VHKLLVLLIVLVAGAAGAVATARSERVDLPGVGRADAERATDRVRDRVTGDGGAPPLREARCPSDVAGCRSVTGRIVFVERVDPDGDGDLHVVIAGGGITVPGMTSVDVRPGLRPDRDPGIGDLATAAGPVQRGSQDQAQIHAVTFRVR
jgi:hypothetical protein